MGVLPSGAYLAKKLLLEAAAGSGQWWWALTLQAGGVLTSSYVVLVLACAMRRADVVVERKATVSRLAQTAALILAVCSLLLAFAAFGPLPRSLLKNPLEPAELASLLVTLACAASGWSSASGWRNAITAVSA